MTPEQIAEQQGFVIPYPDAKRILDDIRAEEQKNRKEELEEIRKARAFGWYGDEWAKVRTRPVGGDNLQLAIAAGVRDLVTGVIFDNELQASVKAVQPPDIDQFQAQYFQQLAIPLAVDAKRPQWLMELFGELKTLEIDSYRRQLKIRAKAREAFGRALVDKCCILKDTHRVIDTPNGPRTEHDVEVVIYGDEFYAQRHRNWDKVSWFIHDKYMEKADFAREYPWIIERYTQGNPAGTAGFFQRFYKPQSDNQYVQKTRDLQKPSVKVSEIWYKMPAERPGAEQFPGGFIVLEVFQDEILRVSANTYLDGMHPFTPIVPLPTEDHWAGKSFIYAHHDGLTAMNKTASMALSNLVDSCNNYRLWNPAALTEESAEAVRRKQVGTRDIILRSGKTWDEAVKEMTPQGVSSSIFDVTSMIQGLVFAATGVNLRKDKQTDQDGKQLGGDSSLGPQLALMLDIVREAHESLFYRLCARGSQFATHPIPLIVDGDQTVTVTINPAIFPMIYGPAFHEAFTLTVSEAEPQPESPTEKTQDFTARVDLASKLTQETGLPLYQTLSITKPVGYTNLVRQMKRAQQEEENNPNKQPTPAEAEKLAIQENEKVKTIGQSWQKLIQEMAADPGSRATVLLLFTSGKARPFLDAAIAGQPFEIPQPPPIVTATQPVTAPTPEAPTLVN